MTRHVTHRLVIESYFGSSVDAEAFLLLASDLLNARMLNLRAPGSDWPRVCWVEEIRPAKMVQA